MKKLFILITALFITSLNAEIDITTYNNLLKSETEKMITGIDSKDIYHVYYNEDKLFFEAYMNSYDNSNPLNPNALLWEMDKFDYIENKDLLANIRKIKYAIVIFNGYYFCSDHYDFKKNEFKYPIPPDQFKLELWHANTSSKLQININGTVCIKADFQTAKKLCHSGASSEIFALVEIKKADFGGPEGKTRILNTDILRYFVINRKDYTLLQSSDK